MNDLKPFRFEIGIASRHSVDNKNFYGTDTRHMGLFNVCITNYLLSRISTINHPHIIAKLYTIYTLLMQTYVWVLWDNKNTSYYERSVMQVKFNNQEVRQAIEKKRLRYYEVADALGITRGTLSVWLSKELSPDKKQEVLDAIDKIQI